ncbi:MAG: hypothetical protein EHM36_12090, partial [Deltaproteobacteria bacterium]
MTNMANDLLLQREMRLQAYQSMKKVNREQYETNLDIIKHDILVNWGRNPQQAALAMAESLELLDFFHMIERVIEVKFG